ncbi:hypothetical protein [Sulfitobacter sp. THAF37]|uniref:hypothetical protein n=1 Tax=Sulfitobacter sp. THAF37 TaxID=2587855 RepID=UPI001268AE66|nr:hypothetical protein [Sulfitobacter sp. THAF37]
MDKFTDPNAFKFEGMKNMYRTPKDTFRLPQPSTAMRAVKMGVREHFTGSFVGGENEGWRMEVESLTEFRVALVMQARPDVVDLENQVLFHWVDLEGQGARHFFDFRVTFEDGTRTALIVKNSRTAAKPDFRAEMRCLASQVPAEVADRVALVTEKHLDPIEVYNAELIHSVRLHDGEPDDALRGLVSNMGGAARIADIVSTIGGAGQTFRAVVRLIRTHALELVRHERIGPEALVRWRPI